MISQVHPGFLTALTEQLGFSLPRKSKLIAKSPQAAVFHHQDSIYKLNTAGQKYCSQGAIRHLREVKTLSSTGGYEGRYLKMPRLKSHTLFDIPLNYGDLHYAGAIELDYMPGRDIPSLSKDHAYQVGYAVSELHALFRKHASALPPAYDLIECRKEWLKASNTPMIPRTIKDSLLSEVSHLTFDNMMVVHGDLHRNNLRFDHTGSCGVLDFATTAYSLPEQDFASLAGSTELQHMLEGYESHSGAKLQMKTVGVLRALDLAAAVEMYREMGRMTEAAHVSNQLQAFMQPQV